MNSSSCTVAVDKLTVLHTVLSLYHDNVVTHVPQNANRVPNICIRCKCSLKTTRPASNVRQNFKYPTTLYLHSVKHYDNERMM